MEMHYRCLQEHMSVNSSLCCGEINCYHARSLLKKNQSKKHISIFGLNNNILKKLALQLLRQFV